MTIRKKLVNKLNKLMKINSNEEKENRTAKQNRNLNIKIDLEKGKVTGNLGSGNQNLPPSRNLKNECCLIEKKERKIDAKDYECYGNCNMFCGLVGEECICCEWKRGDRSSVLLTT